MHTVGASTEVFQCASQPRPVAVHWSRERPLPVLQGDQDSWRARCGRVSPPAVAHSHAFKRSARRRAEPTPPRPDSRGARV